MDHMMQHSMRTRTYRFKMLRHADILRGCKQDKSAADQCNNPIIRRVKRATLEKLYQYLCKSTFVGVDM